MSKFDIGDKVVVVENVHGHKFHIGEEVFISKLTNEDYECTNEFGDHWHLTKDEIKLATVH